MTTQTNLQTTPYLPKQRNFPNQSSQALGVELDKAYIDIANRVNERTIGVFGEGYQIVTGESFFLNGQPRRQQTLRQVYPFVGTPSPIRIPHGIDLTTISSFTRIYGTFTDTATGFWYPIPYNNVLVPADSLEIHVETTDIVINYGGALVVSRGLVVLEWLSVSATNS